MADDRISDDEEPLSGAYGKAHRQEPMLRTRAGYSQIFTSKTGDLLPRHEGAGIVSMFRHQLIMAEVIWQ